MASLEDRLQRVETGLDRITPTLHERLDRLELAVKAPSAPQLPQSPWGRVTASTKRFAAWMGAELPKFLATAVLLFIGWGIKDSVDLSIKQRHLDLSYAKEMQGLLQKMSDKSADTAQLESTAVVLASYGEAALPSLLSELRYTGLRADAAAAGITALALTNPKNVCEALPRILSNRAQQYDWQAHLKVVRLLGENDCTGAAQLLRHYREIVDTASRGKPETFEEIVRAPPLAPAEDYPRLLATIDRSLRVLLR